MKEQLVERVSGNYAASRMLCVTTNHVRSTTCTNLRAEVFDIGICLYHAGQKRAYLANLESRLSSGKDERAALTCRPLIERIRKDNIQPARLYAIIFGDSVQDFEYGHESQQRRYNLQVRRDHHAYRESIFNFLQEWGIHPGKCTDLFAEMQDTYIDVLLTMPDACMEIKEISQRKQILYSSKQFSLNR